MLKINGITYEIIYSYFYPQSKTSASPIFVPMMLKKLEDLESEV